jgi:hypothetical protein
LYAATCGNCVNHKTETDRTLAQKNRGKGHFMNTQPRKTENNFESTELPGSRCRASCAVGGDGEASAPDAADVPASGGATLPPSLEIFYQRAFEMAQRVQQGGISLNDGVDMLHSAAAWAGLTEKYGEDEIQDLMARAIIDASMGEEPR